MPSLKKTILALAACALIGIGGFWYYVDQHYVPAVLMYHSVNPVPNPSIKSLIISPEAFERQMSFLRRYRYNVITLEALGDLLRKKAKVPRKTVVVTFDDGYKDNYTYAFPVLKKYGIPATIFIIIDEVGRPITGDLKPGDARLSWQEIRQMQSSGLIDFGSHTFGAEPLVDKKTDSALKKEIAGSRLALQERLGRQVRIFSYPGGLFNDKIKKMVIDAGYSLAVATYPGKDSANDDLFAIKRVRVSPKAAHLIAFWWDVSGYYHFFKERKRK